MTFDGVALAAFVPVTFLLVITPGATTAVVIRHALVGGHRAGAATAAGAALGNVTHAVGVAIGWSLLLQRIPSFIPVINIGGALYLGWLAIGSFARARSARPPDVAAPSPRATHASAFADGLVVTLLNPAALTFYLVIVPGFIRPPATLGRYALLAMLHVTMALACHLLWTLAFDRLRHLLLGPRAHRAIDLSAGLALAWLAVRTLVRAL